MFKIKEKPLTNSLIARLRLLISRQFSTRSVQKPVSVIRTSYIMKKGVMVFRTSYIMQKGVMASLSS